MKKRGSSIGVHTHTHTHTTLNNDVVDFHAQNKIKTKRQDGYM